MSRRPGVTQESDTPTEFDRELTRIVDALWFTDTQVSLEPDAAVRAIKEAVDRHVIGEDETVTSLDYDWALIETSIQMNGAKPYHLIQARNQKRASERQLLWGAKS